MKTFSCQGGIYRLFPFSYSVSMKKVLCSCFSTHLGMICIVVVLSFTHVVISAQQQNSEKIPSQKLPSDKLSLEKTSESFFNSASSQPSHVAASGISQLSALPLLSLDEALKIALEQNYGVRIARNATVIADNNAQGVKGLGAAGMLPNVNLNGGWNESRDNVRQQFFNGNTQERSGARTDRANAAVQLNWTLFDGLQMFAQRDRLNELQKQSDLALRQAIENTIAQVMTSYASAVEQYVLLSAQGKALELSRQRLVIAEAKARIGSASELDAQNARVDYNADSAAYLRQEAIVSNTKTALLQVLGNVEQYQGVNFRVEDSLSIGNAPRLSDVFERLAKRNAALRMASVDNSLAQIAVRQAEAFHLPTLNATVNYNFSVLDAEAGVIQTAQSNGLNFGFTAQVNIFNGFNIQRQIENARVSALTAELQYQDLENRLKSSLQQTLRVYSNSRTLVQLERDNTGIAAAAAAVALEKFRLGTMSSLDLRQVQQNYVRAESRLITALADAKRAEIEIMRLVGDLTRE